MFDFPVVGISTQYIQKIGRDAVEPGMFREALMASFVHDIEANGGEIKAEECTSSYGNPGGEIKKNK